MKIEKVLDSFKMFCDNNYNLVIVTNPVPQIVPTNVNIKEIFKKSIKVILDDYKIPYSNDNVELFTNVMIKSLERFEHHSDKKLEIEDLLTYNIELNVKEEIYISNYILFSNNMVSEIIDANTIFHQMDFNLESIALNTILGLRIFILAHYAVVLNKQIEIKTPYNKFDLITDIRMEKIDDEKYIFSPKIIKLKEK